jgi:recombinational DNA repair ATPase RecF
MLLEVRDFLSIRHARLETDENHAIIAGRNGWGKSRPC